MKNCYLAGLISTAFPESLRWRDIATAALEEHATVLSPMRGKSDLYLKSKDGGVTDPDLSEKDILLRDYNDIQQADIVLAHLDDFGSFRPMVGTLVELGWAWERKIPIVAVASADNYLMRNHPFIKAIVTRYFETLEDAVSHILSYYLSAPVRQKEWVN